MTTQHIGISWAETDVTKQLNTYPNSVLVVAMTQEDSWQDPVLIGFQTPLQSSVT